MRLPVKNVITKQVKVSVLYNTTVCNNCTHQPKRVGKLYDIKQVMETGKYSLVIGLGGDLSPKMFDGGVNQIK